MKTRRARARSRSPGSGSDETRFLGREVDLKRTPAINDPDQTTGFDHGRIHPQRDLPPISQKLPGNAGFSQAKPSSASSRSTPHRNRLLLIGLFSNDQSLKRSHLCIRGLYAACPLHRIFRRTGVMGTDLSPRPVCIVAGSASLSIGATGLPACDKCNQFPHPAKPS